MIWYYAKDGKPVGPLEDGEFRDLVTQGIIRPDTMVWNQTMKTWDRFERVSLTPVEISSTQCDHCSRPVADDDLVMLDGRRICAECKPAVLQSLKEGSQPHRPDQANVPMDAPTLVNHSRIQASKLEVFPALQESLRFLQSDWSTLAISTALIVIVVFTISSAIHATTGPILGKWMSKNALDILNAALSGLVEGPIGAGLGWRFLKIWREEEHSMATLWEGWSKAPRDLALLGFIQGTLGALCFVPFGFLAPSGWPEQGEFTDLFKSFAGTVAWLGGMLFYFLNQSIWCCSSNLVMDRGYHWKDAMKASALITLRQGWKIAAIVLISTFLSLLGFAALCIGALFTLPYASCTETLVYERLCGREIGKSNPP